MGAFFGFLAGLVVFGLVVLWTFLTRSGPDKSPLQAVTVLHAWHILLYVVGGAVLGYLWPIRRTAAGRWGLWFLATATGAVSVNSVTYGPLWNWSLTEWGHYSLMAILFTPVFAWPHRR